MKEQKLAAIAPPLIKGQLWETERGRVEIVQVGKLLAHYRMFQNKRRAPTLLGRIEMVQDFLLAHSAKPIKNTRLEKAGL